MTRLIGGRGYEPLFLMRWGDKEHLALVMRVAEAAYGTSFPNEHTKRQFMEIVGRLFNRADSDDILKLLEMQKKLGLEFL